MQLDRDDESEAVMAAAQVSEEDLEIRLAIAEAIRREMGAAQLSQTQLAVRCGMKQSTLSIKLTGKSPFTVEQFVRVCAKLDVLPGRLLSGMDTSTAT